MGWQDDSVVDQPTAAMQQSTRGSTWRDDPVFDFKPNAGPPVNAATANMDPRDLRQTNVLTANTPEAIARRAQLASQTGPVDRFVRGSEDVTLGLGQLAARALSPVTNAPAQYLDDLIKQRQEEYRQGRLIRGENPYAVDIPRGAGQAATMMAAAPANVASAFVGPAAQAVVPSLAARTIQGAAQGGALGALGGASTPIEDTQNYAGEKTKQVVLGGMIGGLLTPALQGLLSGASAAYSAIRQKIARGSITPQDIDAAIDAALGNQVKFADLAPEVQNALRQQVGGKLVGQLNPDELRRFADITSVGATPTRGTVSLDPVALTQEKNLAKMGANSSAPDIQALARAESANNQALIQRMNVLGAENAPPQSATGARVINALTESDAARKTRVGQLYKGAENINALAGQVQPFTFDGARFVDQATQALDQAGRGAFLPGEIRSVMQGLAQRGPMNMQQVEQLRTILSTAQRSAQDGNSKYAIGIVRDALEAAEPSNIGGEVVRNAFSRARNAHAARMQLIENVPALKAAIEGVEPDKFVQTFILGSGSKANVADVNALKRAITADPEATLMVRQTIVDHLKTKALSGAAEEFGTFSQSAYNRAINAIGDQKLAAFFSPAEIEQLRQVGRAAAYLQVQPKGSAVNNSNTAAMLTGALDKVLQMGAKALPMVGSIPLGAVNALRTSARNAQQNALARQAFSPFPTVPNQPNPDLLRLVSPAGGLAGVVGAQQ